MDKLKHRSGIYQEVHIRHLNPLNKIPQKVAIVENIIANNLDYKDIEFPEIIVRLIKNIYINVFFYESLSYSYIKTKI